MKSYKKITAVVLALALIFMTGCGDQMYELTDEEENAIVSYSAHVIAKYNSLQNDGIVYVPAQELSEDTEEVSGDSFENSFEDALETETETEMADYAPDDHENPEADMKGAEDSPEDSPETEDGGSDDNVFGNDQAWAEEDLANNDAVSLSQALDLGQVDAEYDGYDITADYVEAGYFSMSADAGKEYFVLKIKLKNRSDENLSVDLLDSKPIFRLIIDGESVATSMTTLLLDDLGTYNDVIKAGDSADTVLLFQVPEGQYRAFGSIGLKVKMNDNTNNVNF